MTEHTHTTSWELPLVSWAEWPGENEGELPKLDFVDPMLRRRLSALSKMSLWAAQQCAHASGDIRMIYASQHGEIVRTTEMLEALAVGAPLSPTAFSMSVLNASIGLYSIIRGNTAPATAIAAGAETFGYALLEAHGQLHSDPERPVLVIYADESIPAVWQSQDQQQPHAVALLLQNGTGARVHCTRTTGLDLADSEDTQAQSFVRSLAAQGDACWNQSRRQWRWQRLVA